MTPRGRPSFTAISKPVRYSSRRVRSSTTLSLVMRSSSWLLAAKCLTQAAAPWDWTPRTRAAESLPDR